MTIPAPSEATAALSIPDTALESVQAWLAGLYDQVVSLDSLWQLLAVIAAFLVAFVLSRVPKARLKRIAAARDEGNLLARAALSLAHVIWPLFTVIILWGVTAGFEAYELRNNGLRIAASLLNAWIIVRLVTSNIKDGFWASALAFSAWMIAALYILRLLDPITTSLDSVALEAGGFRITLLRLVTSAAIAGFALWIGRVAGDAAQSQLRTTKSLTPSMAGLLGQVAKIGLMVIAVVVALYSVGINLTALTVFSGAIGIGVGFGLQAIFSNFISGVIILLEKSVKVGDFIELQSGVTGLVQEINIRSTLITTNDSVDILVPNEEFIKAQVINWTLREAGRRLRVPFGVAYGSDKELVRKAGLEAAGEVSWTDDYGTSRPPQVWLVGFGDSSLDFELVVWLTEEAVKKPAKVKADYNWALHTALEKYGLEIPFPQRDLHFRTPDAIRVRIDSPVPAGDPSD